ncbi:MAG: ferritin-like domain-containing protein [Rhizomicrobium sp.]|jgi:rubrerythrin
MAGNTVYHQGWTLDDIPWSSFDRTKVDPQLLAAVKAASLVEFNAPDYVDYLKRVFRGAPQETLDSIEHWGEEESQHGRALARWAETADPDFNFEDAFARFQSGFKPDHFKDGKETSVRGSRRGEMIARCVVESGTSSFYSAIRDASEEPVLKDIAGRIAADEFRHYKLFFETLQRDSEPELPFWRRVMVAVDRVNESDDDELAYAYYSANIPADRQAEFPYRREIYNRAYHAKAMTLYRRHHISKLVQMVAKAVGANPQGKLTAIASALLWRLLRVRAGMAGFGKAAPVPA